MPSLTSGIPGGQEDVSVRNVPYIIVKGDKLKNVAVRFMVPFKTLRKINKISSKNFTCYPGMTLFIPVKVRPHSWDPSMESSTDAGMLSQDRLPSVDYEVIGDGFDLDIKDDFIPVSEAVDDSVQFVRVGTHITRIDKRVSALTYRMDSLKQAEFTFGHDDDINSVLGRMRMARDRYYINGPLGKEIDSLHRIKATLNNLRIRLRNKITEYEYLRDNEAYAKANYERDEMAKDTHWGDQITYESNYARIKAKHDEMLAADTAAHSHQDTTAALPVPAVQKKDTVPALPVAAVPAIAHDTVRAAVVPATPAPVAEKTMAVPPVVKPASPPVVTPAKPATTTATVPQPPANKPAVTSTAVKPAATIPASPQPAVTTPSVQPAASAGNTAPRVSFGLLQRVDIAPMVIRHAKVNITEHPREKGTLALLPREAMQAINTQSATTAPIPVAAPKKDTTSLPLALRVDTFHTSAVKKADTTHILPLPSVKTEVAAKSTTVHADTVPTKPAVKNTTQVVAIKADTIKKNPAVVAKADTVHKNVATTTLSKDTANHNNSATAHTDLPKNTAPVVQAKDQAKPSPKGADTAHNFSQTEENIFDTPGATSSDRHDQPAAAQTNKTANDNNTDIAAGNTPGRLSKKPKDTGRKEKKPSDIADQVPVVVDSSKILHEQFYVPLLAKENTGLGNKPGPYFTLDLKYDSTMLHREKKINPDPLASYKTDSNFMATDVLLKEIPITEVKNKPKYLIPVDSVSKIKGEFYLIRARQVLERGDFKEGDKYLRKSLELDPNNAATWMLHADLCLTTGAADKALKEYAISGEIDSTNPKVFYNIALLYAKANDNQKAYKYFSRATDVNDKYLLAYMGRATVLMDERDYEGAIQDYDKTLNINRYYSPAYKGRALAKMEAHKFEDAVVDFNQYLEIEDPDGYVLYQRGIAKILSNNLLQGCLDLSSSLELGFKEADRAIKKFCQ